jgi:hypothetical protein
MKFRFGFGVEVREGQNLVLLEYLLNISLYRTNVGKVPVPLAIDYL